jgi:hypothetical protein
VDERVDLLELGIHRLHQALVRKVLLVIRRSLDWMVANEGFTRLWRRGGGGTGLMTEELSRTWRV